MNKKSFLDLLDRYQHQHCSENEKLFVEHWYESLDQEDVVLLNETELSAMSDNIINRLYENIAHQPRSFVADSSLSQPVLPLTETTQATVRSINWTRVSVAASVAIAFIASFLYVMNYNSSRHYFERDNKSSVLMSSVNNSDRPITLKLSDSSMVTLQPGAGITYPVKFAVAERRVFLHGDAFFSISKNPKRPFLVYNNNLRVKVLGTSFYVREADAAVSVRTGKVQVNENSCRRLFHMPGKKTPGVLLTPNQKAEFSANRHEIRKSLVEKPEPLKHLSTGHQQMVFSESPLSRVLATLASTYGVTISMENQIPSECTFTGDISRKELFEQLSLVCQSVSGSYEVKGTEIIVRAGDCK
ncbi:putative anti-sigma factor [Pedobacter sp. BAL39]|uniref:FecR family protein n=1 Tax=Pedobacter sp. BAL39 TaxID=391596 RepID=UPI0001559442|nr:FecR family protein [Pedobacter sp. BAL39]EDM35640.1 putative anti-sigma factor [Pedobacter sp. BAL39]